MKASSDTDRWFYSAQKRALVYINVAMHYAENPMNTLRKKIACGSSGSWVNRKGMELITANTSVTHTKYSSAFFL